MTGIHHITPDENEDYFVLSAKAGKKRYIFWFTVTPRLPQGAATPDLRAILENGRVTQYHVISFVQGKKESKLIACHSRDSNLGCKQLPMD